MVKSYCVKQKKVTECVPGSEKIVKSKKWPISDEIYLCWMRNLWNQIRKGKLIKPSQAGAIYLMLLLVMLEFICWASSSLDGKKAVEMGRYYGS